MSEEVLCVNVCFLPNSHMAPVYPGLQLHEPTTQLPPFLHGTAVQSSGSHNGPVNPGKHTQFSSVLFWALHVTSMVSSSWV